MQVAKGKQAKAPSTPSRKLNVITAPNYQHINSANDIEITIKMG